MTNVNFVIHVIERFKIDTDANHFLNLVLCYLLQKLVKIIIELAQINPIEMTVGVEKHGPGKIQSKINLKPDCISP